MWRPMVMCFFMVVMLCLVSQGRGQGEGPIAWWRFDDVDSERVFVSEEDEDDEEEYEDEDDRDDDEDERGFHYEGDTSLQIAKSEVLEMTEADYTIFARFRTDESGAIFSKAPRKGGWAENAKALFVAEGRLAFDIGWVGVVMSEREVADGDWHHVAITFDHDAGAVRLFVDGKLDAEAELAPDAAVDGHVVRIGFASPDFPNEGRGFEGQIEVIGFYARALSAQEISGLPDGRLPAKGLIAHWQKFDDDEDILIDATGHGHDGHLEEVQIWENEEDAEEEEEEDEDEDEERTTELRYFVRDEVTGVADRLVGFHQLVPGVSGKALRLGGIDAYIVRSEDNLGAATAFTAEAWIALGAYPFHWVPILCQQEGDRRGAFLGIDAHGHLGMKLKIDGEWQEVTTDEKIELGCWAHVACVYDPHRAMRLFLDGQLVAEADVTGRFDQAEGGALLIGRHAIQQRPDGTIRPFGTRKVYTFFDGILDELKIFGRALTDDELAANYRRMKPSAVPELPRRVLPAGPAGPGKFGAFYTTLQYFDAWDSFWRVGQHADVVVRFDQNPCRFVFWRGTSYIPHWVTENGIWYDNEFNETWSERGCHEPMSDKQCRHAHVRIIESNDARVVVHWRYALVDNWYEFARVDDVTGWGDWTDEVYTIYPDGLGVRQVTLHSSQPEAPHEWHEGIIVMGPGQRPEMVLEPAALTLMNMEGETHTYSWANGAPGNDGMADDPPHANVQIVNTKSNYRPIVAVRPQSQPEWDIYAGELRRDVSMFPWWNHWPTAQDPSDGRYAMAADRASHSSLSHCHWGAYEKSENRMTKIMLNGLSNKSPDEILQIVKSWTNPPQLTLQGGDFTSHGYDPAQRAYVVARNGENTAPLKATVAASDDSPVRGLALRVKDWGEHEAQLRLDGTPLDPGKQFRQGHSHGLDGADLIVWIPTEITKPLTVVLD